MNPFLRRILNLIAIVILTLVTQIGGVVYLFSILISRLLHSKTKLQKIGVFTILYLIISFLIVPFIAPKFGREKVINTAYVKPTNFMTIVLNRNYVKKELNTLLIETSKRLKNDGITIRYLDANFPFINKFPLLPHLSHNDGKKLDLSLIYQNGQGKIIDKQKSISGYGVFETPKSTEINQIDTCLSNGYFQYDYPKYLTFGKINQDIVFSELGTRKLIAALLEQHQIGKIFIEPHLKKRLQLKNSKIKYHGCKAVRHDDHIHIQLK